MENFISTIYLRLNSFTDDKLAIGLIYSGKYHAFFNWSENKLKLASKFYKSNTEKILRKEFKNLKSAFESNSMVKDHPFHIGYLSYLNKIDDGLIFYTDPEPVSEELDNKKFNKLFNLYIENSKKEEKREAISSFHEDLRKKLSSDPIFKARADIDYSVSPSIISTILRPHKIDFLSVNGSLLAGFTLDFDQSLNTIENKFYEYRALAVGFEKFSRSHELGSGKYYAFFNKPKEDNKKKILDNAINDDTLPFELKEADKIEETSKLLEEKNYRKFSEFFPNTDSNS